MSITSFQNNKESVALIAAQRNLYAEAKKLRTIRLLVSFGLAIVVAPITIILFPDYKVEVGVLSSIWIIVMFLLNHFENRKIKYAATVQEQFDITVFSIDWNNFLVGNKISPEIIANAARKHKGGIEKLRNWYGNLDGIPQNVSVLLCQRSNLVWDWRLRRYFAWTIIICLLILIGLETTIAYYTGISKQEFILGLFLPSISAIIIGVREIIAHFEIAYGKEKLEGQLTTLLDQIIAQKGDVNNQKLRQIQDKIFDLRKKAALIPDWWHNILKEEFENDMQNSNDIYKEKIQKH